uniref:Growth-inhibiting protein 6 n=1 Tax=Homo sapiens TaxID=9606 RepID=B6RHJ7_HUMAN|nr:growth-inhibiting protein 6 [Homo sapiens]
MPSQLQIHSLVDFFYLSSAYIALGYKCYCPRHCLKSFTNINSVVSYQLSAAGWHCYHSHFTDEETELPRV